MVDIQGMDSNCKTRDIDISQLCRLCAAQDENLVPIFEGPGLELDLEVKLHKYLSLTVSKKDELPDHICMKCSNTLILWHELVIGCREAEKRFIILLSEKRTTTNEVEDIILVDEDSQASVKVIENDDQPSSKPDNDSSVLRNTLRAKLCKLLRRPGFVNDIDKGHQNSSPESGNIVTVSTNTAMSQHSPQALLIDQSEATAIVGTTRLLQSHNSNSAVIQPRLGLLAVGPSTSTEGTVLVSQGLNNENAVLIEHTAGKLQSQPTSSGGSALKSKCLDRRNPTFTQTCTGKLIFDQSSTAPARGTVPMSTSLDKENAVIIQTSTGQFIYDPPPTDSGGNFVQLLHNRSVNRINVPSVIRPSIGQRTVSQSLPCSDVKESVPALGQKFKTNFKKVLLFRPEGAPAAKSYPDSPEENSDLVALLISEISPNTDPLSSSAAGTKSPVIAVPVILSRKPTGHAPSPCNGESTDLVPNPNSRLAFQESTHNVLNKDAADLVDNIANDSRGPSLYPSDSSTHTSWENVQVEAASQQSGDQSKVAEKEVILGTNKSASAGTDPFYFSSFGDHRYSKSVKYWNKSAPDPPKKDDTGTRHCLSYAVLRKSEIRKCFVCGKMIHNRTLLLSHEKSHFRTLNSSILKCRLCTGSFETFDEMVLHRRNHQKEEGDMFIRGKHRKAEVKRSEEVSEPKSPKDINFAYDDFGTSEVPSDDGNPPEVSNQKTKRSRKTPKKTTSGMKCSMCGLFFKKRVELNEHKLTHSEGERAKPYPCTTCGKRFNSSNSLNLHSELHSDVTKLCPHCGRVFKQRAALSAHIRRKHGDPTKLPSHKCKFCPKTFEFPGKLMVHMRSHTGERPYVCDKCGKSFRTRGTFTQHLACHEDARPRKCKICGKGFKWTKNLIQHSLTHVSKHLRPVNYVTNRNKKKPTQCNICGKTFYNIVSAKLHKIKLHRDVFLRECPESESLVCHLCPRIFSEQTSLNNHLEQYHAVSEKGFRCEVCPKRFAMKARRDAHSRLHTGERPFSCEHCDKSFAASSYLKAHLVCHSESRRHSCEYCDKQFKKKAHLNVHVRSHTGEKPYVCDVCGRRFTQVSDKNRHRGTHFDGRPFECAICESFFKKKQELVDHMAEQHPEAVNPGHVFEKEIEIDYSAILPSDYEDPPL